MDQHDISFCRNLYLILEQQNLDNGLGSIGLLSSLHLLYCVSTEIIDFSKFSGIFALGQMLFYER
jgi:hypothetical protein